MILYASEDLSGFDLRKASNLILNFDFKQYIRLKSRDFMHQWRFYATVTISCIKATIPCIKATVSCIKATNACIMHQSDDLMYQSDDFCSEVILFLHLCNENVALMMCSWHLRIFHFHFNQQFVFLAKLNFLVIHFFNYDNYKFTIWSNTSSLQN